MPTAPTSASDVFSGGSFVYDPWVLYQSRIITNPNVLLAGVIGSGKSIDRQGTDHPIHCPRPQGLRPVRPEGGVDSGRRGDGRSRSSSSAPDCRRGSTRSTPAAARQQSTADEWQRIVWSRRRALLGTLAESTLGRPLTAVEHTALDLALDTSQRSSRCRRSLTSSWHCSRRTERARVRSARPTTAARSRMRSGDSCTAICPACSTGPRRPSSTRRCRW